MLLRETGRYLFEHTVTNLRNAKSLCRIVLATDCAQILEAAESVGIETILTSERHPSGTDRIHEALHGLLERGNSPWDVILNVQGDEPELPVRDVDRLVLAFRDPEVELATLGRPMRSGEDVSDPNLVKVVVDQNRDAIYFSRSRIPFQANPPSPARGEIRELPSLRCHIGVYAFRPSALDRFCSLPTGHLEKTENLEQLRWLENGGRIRVVDSAHAAKGIDTREDYVSFRDRLGTKG